MLGPRILRARGPISHLLCRYTHCGVGVIGIGVGIVFGDLVGIGQVNRVVQQTVAEARPTDSSGQRAYFPLALQVHSGSIGSDIGILWWEWC